MSLFDYLPLDVINYVIRPFVGNDYFARVGLNSLLPPTDRQGTPLRRDAVKEFELSLAAARLKPLVERAVAPNDPQTKAKNIGEVFDFLIRDPLITQHQRQFRETAMNQARTFADPDYERYKIVSVDESTALVERAQRLLDLMNQRPFLYQIATSLSNEKWSPIVGTALPTIVDNTQLLADARRARGRRGARRR